MRILATALLLATLHTSPAQPAGEAAAGASPKEIALDHLLSERGSAKALEEVIAAARKAGVSEQAILEARFLYHVDLSEDDAISAMLPEFQKRRDTFAIEDSAIFAEREDWLAVVEYVQAIAALKGGDKNAFKTHITEAFWLSPRQASAFAPHIERLRLQETMDSVRIDFATRLLPLGGGDVAPLSKLMDGRKAMILHFWSPASRECADSMPDYAITAKALEAKGVAMTSVLPAGTEKSLADARELIKPLGPEAPGAWLVDDIAKPLSRELRVQSLPVFVLVSNEGRILFNGEPSDDALWEALRKIDTGITRPEAPSGGK